MSPRQALEELFMVLSCRSVRRGSRLCFSLLFYCAEKQASAANPETQRFHFISADLADAAENKRVLEEVTAWNHGRSPDIVWCIAGSAYPEFFVHTDITRLREQMDQNYWSAAYMAHAVLQDWLKPAGAAAPAAASKTSSAGSAASSSSSSSAAAETATKHLIFTSSIAAFYPMVGYTPYVPAKAALRALSDALQQELRLYNGARRRGSGHDGPASDVQIHTVLPGTIYSPGYEQEKLTRPAVLSKLEEGDEGQTEDQVAAASLRGLQNGEYLVTTTFVGSCLRGAAWCGSPRNNWLIDTLMTWAASFAWMWVQGDMDGKVSKWGVENGHPATYRRAN